MDAAFVGSPMDQLTCASVFFSPLLLASPIKAFDSLGECNERGVCIEDKVSGVLKGRTTVG